MWCGMAAPGKPCGRHRRGGFETRPYRRSACCRPYHRSLPHGLVAPTINRHLSIPPNAVACRRACCRPYHRSLPHGLVAPTTNRHMSIPRNTFGLIPFDYIIVITDGTVGAGLKPARIIAAPVVAPVVARTIAAYHTDSWHQRQADTSVNCATRRQINAVSLCYCDNGRHRRGGFQTRPNHRRARRHPHHRHLCNWLLCLPSEFPSGYSDYAIGSD